MTRTVLAAVLALSACAHGSPASAEPAAAPASAVTRDPDVPYVPTPPAVVEEMLRLAAPRAGNVLYDLGCGDGRIVIAAAKGYGARAVGVDIDPERVADARRNAAAAGVARQVEFRQGDLFEVDLHDADVVTLYLLPDLNLRLRPKLLAELKPGARVVSHAFDMGDWAPERKVKVGSATVYLWTIPERAR